MVEKHAFPDGAKKSFTGKGKTMVCFQFIPGDYLYWNGKQNRHPKTMMLVRIRGAQLHFTLVMRVQLIVPIIGKNQNRFERIFAGLASCGRP